MWGLKKKVIKIFFTKYAFMNQSNNFDLHELYE